MVVILFDCFRQIAEENHSLMPNFVKVKVKTPLLQFFGSMKGAIM